ncbi:hypothetical protein [Streptomyces sp. AA1529]|uniref:hypothetical protein n=1 Tax=Streptomyces sp. AA1529 TaxID=1203257 RepID=UPI003D726BAF
MRRRAVTAVAVIGVVTETGTVESEAARSCPTGIRLVPADVVGIRVRDGSRLSRCAGHGSRFRCQRPVDPACHILGHPLGARQGAESLPDLLQ